MVHHDADTRRCTGRRRVIAATHSAELRSLDAGSWMSETFRGETIPFLDEVLAEVPAGGQVFVEVKSGTGIIEPLSRVLESAPARARVTVISFDAEVLRACRACWPGLPVLWVLEAHGVAGWNGVSLDVVERAHGWGFTGIDPDHVTVNARLVEAAREAGLLVGCWTVNGDTEARRMAALGVDALTTDYPSEIRAAL